MLKVVVSYNEHNYTGVAPRGVDVCVPGLFKVFCKLDIPVEEFDKFMRNVYYVFKTDNIKREVYMADYRTHVVEDTQSVLLEATFVTSNRRS